MGGQERPARAAAVAINLSAVSEQRDTAVRERVLESAFGHQQ